LAEAVGSPLPAGPKVEIPSVDWWTTSRCNLACDFCYGPVPGKDPVELRYDTLQAIKASSARAVTFCGGEPLLLKKVGEWAGALRQLGKRTVLNTNGELLRRRLDQGLNWAASLWSVSHSRARPGRCTAPCGATRPISTR
jgi:MoaA/NifB/PqqE/SkfB family radical SAM enzyme